MAININRLLSEEDSFEIGSRTNLFKQTHYWLKHLTPIKIGKEGEQEIWNLTSSFEIDHRAQKYLTRENSFSFALSRPECPWSYKAESTLRKNVIDKCASADFITNDSLPTIKNSIGAEYNIMSPKFMRRFDSELGLYGT